MSEEFGPASVAVLARPDAPRPPTGAAVNRLAHDGSPALRRLPVPVAEPRPAFRLVRSEDHPLPVSTPHATDEATARVLRPVEPAVQLTLQVLPGLEPAADPTPGDHPDDDPRWCMPSGDLGTEGGAPTPWRSHGALPEPRRWAGQFVQAAVEVATGHRAASQLVRWTTEDVHAMLARRNRLALRREGRPPTCQVRVRSVHTMSPRLGVVEACAVVSDQIRYRAVAIRLEGERGRWRVTAFEMG